MTATTARKLAFSARRSTHQPSVGGKTAFSIFTNDNRESVIVFPFHKITDALTYVKGGGDLEWTTPIKAVKKPWTGGFLAQQNAAMDAAHAAEVAAMDAAHAAEVAAKPAQERIQTLEESYFEDEEETLDVDF